MRKLALLSAAAALALAPTAAFAFHKPGHIAFPGAPSGQFVLFALPAGATCTEAVPVPEGTEAVVHGGPKKFGFIGEELIEVVVISEDPLVVQFCLVEGQEPLAGDVFVRVSFEAPEEAE